MVLKGVNRVHNDKIKWLKINRYHEIGSHERSHLGTQ